MSLLEEKEISDFSTLRDEEVLTLSLAHPDTFAVLVDRYEAPFTRRARKILRERELVEDVVQETFTKIYLNAGKFKKVPGASFKSWGYKILLNTSFTLWQKRKRDREVFVELSPEGWEMIADAALAGEGREMGDYVASILTRLPKHLSSVLSLHFLEGRSHKEIARQEGMSVGAVKTRVYRAKRAFEDIMSHIL